VKVSIIIATYGDAEWEDLALTRAAPSAERQDAYEVLVGHDPDATIGPVRNALAEKATGEWLCFLDADDELAPGYLGAMARAFEQERGGNPETTALLLTPAVSQVRKGRPSPPKFYPEVDLLQANWLIVGTLIPRWLFSAVGGFHDYDHGFEDWSLWNKAYRYGARVVKVPKAVYVQHVNPQSKHRQGWRNRRWQVETHQRVQRELEAWTP
jgi:glycosyltransferase involved in cell wall biosynthesis